MKTSTQKALTRYLIVTFHGMKPAKIREFKSLHAIARIAAADAMPFSVRSKVGGGQWRELGARDSNDLDGYIRRLTSGTIGRR